MTRLLGLGLLGPLLTSAFRLRRLTVPSVPTAGQVEWDRFGRLVAKSCCRITPALSHRLVAAGLGWWYEAFAKSDRALRVLEERAWVERRGRWSDGKSPGATEKNRFDRALCRNTRSTDCKRTIRIFRRRTEEALGPSAVLLRASCHLLMSGEPDTGVGSHVLDEPFQHRDS